MAPLNDNQMHDQITMPCLLQIPILPMQLDEDDDNSTLVSSLSLDDSLLPKRRDESTMNPSITYDQFLEELMMVANHHQASVPPTEVIIPVRNQQIFRSLTTAVGPSESGGDVPVVPPPEQQQVPQLACQLQPVLAQQVPQLACQLQPVLAQESLPVLQVELNNSHSRQEKLPCQTITKVVPAQPVDDMDSPARQSASKAQLSTRSLSPTSLHEQQRFDRDSDKMVLGSTIQDLGKSSLHTVRTSSTSSTGDNHNDAVAVAAEEGCFPKHETHLLDTSIKDERSAKLLLLRQIRRSHRKDVWRRFTLPILRWMDGISRPSTDIWSNKLDWKQVFGCFA
jgi:hypothetical protein